MMKQILISFLGFVLWICIFILLFLIYALINKSKVEANNARKKELAIEELYNFTSEYETLKDYVDALMTRDDKNILKFVFNQVMIILYKKSQ